TLRDWRSDVWSSDLRTVRLAILVWEVPAETVPKTMPNPLPGTNPPLSVNKGTVPVSVKERSELLRLCTVTLNTAVSPGRGGSIGLVMVYSKSGELSTARVSLAWAV